MTKAQLSSAIVFIFLLLICIQPVKAEEYSSITGNTVLGQSYGIPKYGNPGEVTLVTEMAFFFKTLEIFNLQHMEGETFTGYRLPLRLQYQPRHDLSIELGALLGHDFGDNNRLNQTSPLVRIVYEPSARLFIIGGSLIPTHWIHDAFHDDVQKFRTDVEQGFQLRVDKPWFKNDTWLNWRVREEAVEAEEFEIGLSNQIRPLGDIVHLDTQFMWTHAGGQISSSGRLEQNLIYLAGVSIGKQNPLGITFCEDIRLGYAWMYSREENDHMGLVKGYGRAYSAHADFRVLQHFIIRGFYETFAGDDFISTLGDPLYRLDQYDQLGTNLLFNVGGDKLFIEVGFVEQKTGQADNLTYQVSMTWRDDFRLGKLRKH